ncbi:hypothetical protein ACJX0J_019247, partial [Zea mays]
CMLILYNVLHFICIYSLFSWLIKQTCISLYGLLEFILILHTFNKYVAESVGVV